MNQKFPIKHFYKGFYDGPHATPKFVEDGPIFLGLKNLTEDGQLDLSEVNCISEQDFQKWTKRVCPQANDIVFVYEAGLHRYAIIPDGFLGCLGRRIALIRPNTEKILPRFLLFYFLSNEWKSVISSKIFSGATVDRIPLIDFPEFEVSIPSLQAQKQISAILSAYDRLIENNKRRIALLEKMAEEIYREWFVRMRFPGHEQVELVLLRASQEEDTTLDEVCDLIVDCEHKTAPVQELGYPSIRTPNIGKGRLLLENVNRVSEEIYKLWTKRAIPQSSDLVLAREAPVGNVAIIPDDLKICLGQRVALIRPNKSKIKPYYLLFLLLSSGIQDRLLGLSNGATVHHLNMKDIRNLKLPVIHSLEIQDEFDSIVSKQYELIATLTEQNQNLEQTRDRLLPRLISGKLAVEDLDIQFPPA
jgi:type I restriction enzyme, S subunit